MLEKRIIELLTRKMAGEATQEELQELNRLIITYPDTLHLEEVFKQIWEPKPEEEDIDFFYERHKNRHHHELEFKEEPESYTTTGIPFFTRYQYTIRVACVLAVLFIGAYFLFYSSRKINGVESGNTQIIAGKGVRKLITLPDGTKVWLNADSKLTYDNQMNQKAQRKVELTGEAFFDVAHDKNHPFVLHAEKISIKVLGTAFNVKAYPDDAKCEATLLRGSIELTVNEGSSQKFILKPSEKFALVERETKKDTVTRQPQSAASDITVSIENVKPVKVAQKDYYYETSWTENKLIFENETFEELVPKLERWYNVKIEVNNESIKKYHFTGVFTNETIDQALDAMKLIKSFNYKINDNDITIY